MSQYPLLNPYFGGDLNAQELYEKRYPYEAHVAADVSKIVAANPSDHIGVYFRDLTDPSWIGVNPDEEFSPGSLSKVPLMMAILDEAQDSPALLQQKIIYNGPDYIPTQNIKPSQSITLGQAYTVDDMVSYMIRYSDDNAFNALLNLVTASKVQDIFADFGVNLPLDSDSTNADFISPRSYALFFRSLYNAAYLDHTYSNQALELLAQTDYTGGLVAGVPAGTTVAHKFGERSDAATDGSNSTVFEFHDCGIVYGKDSTGASNNYLLCVMTKGSSLDAQQQVVASISKAVWGDVAKYATPVQANQN
jgi:beta-lactamase class A